MKNIMNKAVNEARETMNKNYGGPFGAVIADKNGNIISIASNLVLKNNDPTAHAEVMAIRKACEKLQTHDLSGYILFATGYPCPMCISAIIWSNIKEVYYGTDLLDAQKIGFRDEAIYEYLKHKTSNILSIKQLEHDECLKLFKEYHEKNKEIY